MKKLKRLGPMLVAVLALSGVMAATAQAETTIESELAAPAVTTLDANDVTGTEDGKLARFTIGTGARFFECTQPQRWGGATITGSSLTVNATPTYEKCFMNALKSAPVTVTHNKCTLKLTTLKTNTGNVTIECPHGGAGQIELHAFESESTEKENKPLCTYDIKPQLLTGAGITAAGAGSTRDLTLNLSTLSKLTLTNTGPGGVAVCGIASGAVGTGAFTGKTTVTGTNSAKTQVGIQLLSAQVDTPIESNLAAPAVTTLDANDVTGTEDGKLARLTIGTGARFIECTQARLLSNVAITGSASTVTATPKYEACFANAAKTAIVTVAHNGCTFTLTATKESAGKVLGDVTIDCAEGKQIEVHDFENEKTHAEKKQLCTYDIKPQTLTGAEITSAGAGETQDLILDLSTLSKLKLTNTGPGGTATCGIASGAEGTGSLTGKITITGTNSSGTQVGVKLG